MFCSTNGGDGPCDHANYVNRFNLIYMVPCRPEMKLKMTTHSLAMTTKCWL